MSTEPGASARYERQKQRILDAATLLLNQKGLWAMTLQEVAAALDLTTSSVTYYFKRKELLAEAVFEDSLRRLGRIADAAAREATPRGRVARYVELYFDQFARTRRGDARPFAILSEIRTLDEESHSRLIAQYQAIFRTVRGFFGPIDSHDRRTLLTARAHILNETLFWAELWLQQYALGDLGKVRRRLLDVLDGGLMAPGAGSPAEPLRLDPPRGIGGQQAFLRVATRLINEHGYRGASVERITGELKRNKTSFYRHLDGKDELVGACSRKSFHRLAALQRLAHGRHASPWRRITALLSTALTLQFRGEFPLLRSSALQALPQLVRQRAVAHAHRTALRLMGSVVDGIAEGSVRPIDPLIAAHYMMSSIDAAYDLRGWRQRETVEDAVRVYRIPLERGLFDAD